jgi:hypothetical protein
VIVLIPAVYNGPDHKSIHNGREIPAGSRIVIATANVDFLVGRGLVRYLTPEEDGSPFSPAQTVDLPTAVKQLVAFAQTIETAAAQNIADQEEWLDHTPLMAADLPESVALALFDAGFVSKAKLHEVYAENGIDGLLVVSGIGRTRAIKVLRWAGVAVE